MSRDLISDTHGDVTRRESHDAKRREIVDKITTSDATIADLRRQLAAAAEARTAAQVAESAARGRLERAIEHGEQLRSDLIAATPAPRPVYRTEQP